MATILKLSGGPPGAPGTAATVSVGTVTTGSAGSSAAVVNAGTTGAAVLNFTIPRGDTGATGATGATGPTGPGAAWGILSGTLGDQTDLSSALDAKQPLDADLTDIAALTTHSFGRGLLEKTSAEDVLNYIGGDNLIRSIGEGSIVQPVKAFGTLSESGINNNILCTAVLPGSVGDGITVTLIASGTPLVVSVDGTDVTVNISGSVTTAAQVIDAINNDFIAPNLITATTAPGNDGTGTVAGSTTTLAGGVDADPAAARIGQWLRQETATAEVYDWHQWTGAEWVFRFTDDETLLTEDGIHAATSKATPADADEIPLADSAALFGLKKLTWANLKTTLNTYFSALFQSLNSDLTDYANAADAQARRVLIGSEHLTRTSAQGAPFAAAGLRVTGAPEVDGFYYLNGLIGGKPRYSDLDTDAMVRTDAGVRWTSGLWTIFNFDDYEFWTSSEDVATPDLVEVWEDVPAESPTGYPVVIVEGATVADHIGQWCRVGDSDPYDWWQWTGDAWEFRYTDGVDPLARANHTGTQDVSTITGLGTAATANVEDLSSPPLSLLFQTELARHQQVSATNQQLTLWTLGDSMMSSSRLPGGMVQLLHQKVPIIGYALQEVLTTVTSGTVTSPPANANGSERTDLWDSGMVWLMSASAVIQASNSNGSTVGVIGSKANFYFSKQASGGIATVEYSRNGGSSWNALGTVNTAGTAGEIARGAFTPGAGLGHYIYRITATGNPVNYIGCKIWDDTRSGVILCNSSMGGLPLSVTLLAPAATRNTIAADMGKVLLVTQFREGPGELTEAILDDFLDAWETALPNGEILLIDQLDTPSLQYNDDVTPVVNALYAAASAARPTVRNYHINAVVGTETQRDHAGFYNATVKGTVTVNTSTNVLTCSAPHSFAVGTEVTFSTTGVLAAPLVAWDRVTAQRYFVKTIPTATTFTLSLTDGGDEIDITDSGSGTHSVTQTDTIHMSADAWRYVGSQMLHNLTNYAEGQAVGQVFRDGSGGKEVIFGGLAEEYTPNTWLHRMAIAKGRWGLIFRNSTGGLARFGWSLRSPTDTYLPNGTTLESTDDNLYRQPLVLDRYGCTYLGPYSATNTGARAKGAWLWVEQDEAARSVLTLKHQHATPTSELLDIENSAGTAVFGVNYLGRIRSNIPTYADDAAADADAALVSGQLYRTTGGGRAVYQKP